MAHEKSNLIGCVSFVNTYSLLILLDCGYSVVSGVLVVFILTMNILLKRVPARGRESSSSRHVA